MAMPAETFPEHPLPWTLEEFLALPEDNGQRLELIDGAVYMSPAPTPHHQRVLQWLQMALLDVLPTGHELLLGVNVVLNRRRLLIPDLVVTNTPGHMELYFTGDQIVLAAEILSPSSRTYDRMLKRKLYAEAGVPFYLMVDPVEDAPVAVLYELDGDDYREITRSDTDGWLTMVQPFGGQIDLLGGR